MSDSDVVTALRCGDDEVREVAARPQGAARHYLCAMVPSWGGEVVASTFLHFSTDGSLLYLECARTVLEPPRQGYHDVDRLPAREDLGYDYGARVGVRELACGANCAELTRPDADPNRVTGLLQRLATVAAPVAPVATAVGESLRLAQAV
ncbi:hypothetical protein [Micromonospora sp. NPDC047074]|uniref:hypothetical protein n=1 Tax=Micromonospora sp. NPDC047074 TaxID=3154339 RepID=UPI0033D178ED